MSKRHKPYGPGDGRPVITGFSPAQFRQDRLDAGLTRSSLATASRVGRETLAGWERGKHQPSQRLFPRVLDILWRES